MASISGHIRVFDSLGGKCSSYKSTVKPVEKRPLSERPKIGFQNQLSLNAGQNYCRMLQYFRTSLSYHLSLRSLFCLFLCGRFTFKSLLIHFIICQILSRKKMLTSYV